MTVVAPSANDTITPTPSSQPLLDNLLGNCTEQKEFYKAFLQTLDTIEGHPCCSSHTAHHLTSASGHTKQIWIKYINKHDHFMLFLELLTRAIDSYSNCFYTHFDAQTTSNCCHGLSIYARGLILSVTHSDINAFKDLFKFDNYNSTQGDITELENELLNKIPGPLIDLTSLYTLTYIIENDSIKGRRTKPQKLQELGRAGRAFCDKITRALQKRIASLVAKSYTYYAEQINNQPWIENSLVSVWSNYISKKELRSDNQGIMYASSLYSMQVSLAYLTYSNALVAIINDLVDSQNNKVTGRYIRFLKNDGHGVLTPLSSAQVNSLKSSSSEPVVVFGGYSINAEPDIQTLSLRMQPWIYQVPSLILACDTHYPQFPNSNNSLDTSPIQPTEPFLNSIIQTHANIKGVSVADSSLFCLSHIFLSNPQEILNSQFLDSDHLFPSCFIPCEALFTTPS